jgi:hypothetical protein
MAAETAIFVKRRVFRIRRASLPDVNSRDRLYRNLGVDIWPREPVKLAVEDEGVVIRKYDRPLARLVPEAREDLSDIREAVEASKRLQREMSKRRGFRPFTDEEIERAKEQGRQ